MSRHQARNAGSAAGRQTRWWPGRHRDRAAAHSIVPPWRRAAPVAGSRGGAMADLATTRHGAFVETLRERVLPLRGRAEVRNGWLRQRLETGLPELMAREGFDLWIVA